MTDVTRAELEARVRRLEKLMLAMLWGRPEQHQQIGYSLAWQVKADHVASCVQIEGEKQQ